jgi:hypothetical protein
MLNFRENDRALDTVEYLASGRKGINIPTGQFLHYLYVRMSGTVTVASQSAGAVLDDGAMSIPTFHILADGREIKRIPGRALYYDNIARYGFAGEETDPTAATDAAYAVACEYRIPFTPKVNNPSQFMLPTGQYNSLRLEVSYSDLATTLFNSSFNGTAVSTNLACEVVGVFSDHDIQRAGGNFPVYVQTYTEEVLTATNTEFKIKLDKGDANIFYTDLTIFTTDAGVRDGDILNKLDLRYTSEQYRFKQLSEYYLQNKWKALSGSATEYTGVYPVHIMPDGLPNSAVSAQEQLEVVLNATKGTGTTLVHVLRGAIIS